jgi:predicted kinase
MSKPKVIILCGLPCSGKSTFSCSSDYDDYIHLSTDTYIEQVAKLENKTYNDVWKGTIKPAAKIFYGLMCLAATTNKNVLIDQTNLTVQTRRLKIDLFQNHEPTILFFNTPLELIKERNCRPGKNIPDYVIESMYKTLQIPTEEEANIVTVQ